MAGPARRNGRRGAITRGTIGWRKINCGWEIGAFVRSSKNRVESLLSRFGAPVSPDVDAHIGRRIVPGQGQGIAHPWNLALGQGEGRGQRRAWDAGANPLGLVTTMALSVPRANSDVLDENGEVKIVIEMAKAPKRED